LQKDKSVKLVDVRSREEFEAGHIKDSNKCSIVIVDHQGESGLDASANFIGHGLKCVRCLRGGIDASAQEVDTPMRCCKLG
jgi:hypothetical protein